MKEIIPGGRPGSKVARMPKLKGIHYIVDEKGRKKSVVLSYKAYLQIMQEYADLCKKSEREHEVAEDLVIQDDVQANR